MAHPGHCVTSRLSMVGFGKRQPTLVSRTLRRRIFRDVLTAHLVLIVLPAGWYFVKQWLLARKPPMITVMLVNDVPSPTPAAVETPAPTPSPPAPEPPAPTPTPAVTPPPPTPAPAPPKPAPPPKPTWQPRSAKDITISKDVVKQSKPTPTTPQVSAADLEARFRKISRQMQVAPSGPAGPASQVPASYYDTVATFLYQRWAQPSRAELGGRKPTVAVTLTLDASGKIKSANITRRSGMAAMDSSVEALLAGLTALPAPPNGAITLSINLEIVDD